MIGIGPTKPSIIVQELKKQTHTKHLGVSYHKHIIKPRHELYGHMGTSEKRDMDMGHRLTSDEESKLIHDRYMEYMFGVKEFSKLRYYK